MSKIKKYNQYINELNLLNSEENDIISINYIKDMENNLCNNKSNDLYYIHRKEKKEILKEGSYYICYKGESVGNFRVEKVGDIYLDENNSIGRRDDNKIFKNSIFFSGGFIIKEEYRKKGIGKKIIKKIFSDNPDIQNIFLYAVKWQNAINFWLKIGGEVIAQKEQTSFIQLNRNKILKNNYLNENLLHSLFDVFDESNIKNIVNSLIDKIKKDFIDNNKDLRKTRFSLDRKRKPSGMFHYKFGEHDNYYSKSKEEIELKIHFFNPKILSIDSVKKMGVDYSWISINHLYRKEFFSDEEILKIREPKFDKLSEHYDISEEISENEAVIRKDIFINDVPTYSLIKLYTYFIKEWKKQYPEVYKYGGKYFNEDVIRRYKDGYIYLGAGRKPLKKTDIENG